MGAGMSRIDNKFQVSPPSGYKWLLVSSPIVGLEYHWEEAYSYVCDLNKELSVLREPYNEYDKNAIAFYHGAKAIGHLPKEVAIIISELPQKTPLKCAVRKIYLADDDCIDIDVAVFAQTDLPLSKIVYECKNILSEGFEKDDLMEDKNSNIKENLKTKKITVVCPNCERKFEVDNEISGQEVECSDCYEKFIAKGILPPPQNKKCPFCSETILYTAIKCKHCGEMLDGSTNITKSKILIQQLDAPQIIYGNVIKKRHPVETFITYILAASVSIGFFPIGIIFGVLILILGKVMDCFYICSICQNKIEKTTHVCPFCNSVLS